MARASLSLPARGALVTLVLLVSAPLFYLIYTCLPVLYDADGYYHLAVARAYAERGIFHTLDWARFSVMHEGFGDKEVLFHVVLIPFARLGDPTAGGFMALAGFSALVAALLAGAGLWAIGAWGLAVPLLVFAGATDFSLRMVRLRPELLSLLLILVAISLASMHRLKTLGIVAVLYALGYTAFQTLLGLCVLFVPIIPVAAYRVFSGSRGYQFIGKVPVPRGWKIWNLLLLGGAALAIAVSSVQSWLRLITLRVCQYNCGSTCRVLACPR